MARKKKKKGRPGYRSLGVIPLLLFLFACATPRVSTDEERRAAEATIATVETVVVAGKLAGKIKAEDFELAVKTIAQLRTAIAASEATPVDWVTVYQRVLNLAAMWVEAKHPPTEPSMPTPQR